MNAKDLAQQLTGSEYRLTIPKELRLQAKAAGLVIVYGASDDLMEFDGAIHDEIDCYDGGTVRIDSKGIVPNFDELDKDDKDALRDYFQRENAGKIIEALWDSDLEPGYSWTYKTAIPHETFEIVEDGAPYCRGIVFSLADVK